MSDLLRKIPRIKASAIKAKKLAGRVRSLVNAVIGKITGYKIATGEVPAREARFERKRVGWVAQALDPVWEVTVEATPLMIPLAPADFLTDFDPKALAAEFRQQLASCRTRQVIFIATGFVSDLSLTADGSLNQWLEIGLPRAAEAVQEVLRLEPKLGELTLGFVTMGQGSVITEAIAAFFKALRKECPEIGFKHIRLDDADPKIEALRWIREEMRDPLEWEVSYRDGVRYVARLEAMPDPDALQSLPPDAVVVAVGGAKGITQNLLLGLDRVGHLHLCGRSSDTEIAPHLDTLRTKHPGLSYESVDATKQEEIAPYLERILEKHGHIDLLIHASGQQTSRALGSKSPEEIRSELWAKALSAAHVVRAVAANPPRRILFFSSVVSWFGNPGQTIYAAANAVLDRFCRELNSAWGAGSAASLLWPPWDGVGLASNRAIRQALVQKGLSLLAPEKAADLFRQDLFQSEGPVLYFDETDWLAYGQSLATGFPELLGYSVAGRGVYRYVRRWDPAFDIMLSDHRIEGLACLPAAAGVALSLASLYLHRKRWVGLSEFVAQSPIVVGDKGADLSVEAREGQDGLEITISTDQGSFRAKEAGGDAVAMPPIWHEAQNAQTVGSRQIYSPMGLFHGPAFQTLPNLLIDSRKNAVTRLNTFGLADLFPTDYTASFWGRLIQWIDTAFQMTAVVEIERSGSYCLPVRVGQVLTYFTHRPSEKVSLRLEAFDSDGITVKSDVGIFDEHGRCFLWLRGIEMKVARHSAAVNTSLA